jgi:hypothetical protein
MLGKRIVIVALVLVVQVIALALVGRTAMNTALAAGVVEHFANVDPSKFELSWDRAVSRWPGHVEVTGLHLRLEDPVLQLQLTIEHADVDVVLSDLVQKVFHASRVRASGVRVRFVLKPMPGVAPQRLDAFPPIDGLPPGPLRALVLPPFPTGAALDAIWSVKLDDVDATVSELWFVEYRWVGEGEVQGSFALSPLRHLEVGPASLQLASGELTVGDTVVAAPFAAALEVTIAPVDKPQDLGIELVRSVSTSLRFDTTVQHLSVLQRSLPGITVQGQAHLVASVHVANGVLSPGSSVEAWAPELHVARDGVRVEATAHTRLEVDGAGTPTLTATATGVLRAAPFEHEEVLAVALSGVDAKCTLATNDLLTTPSLARATARVAEARLEDASVITRVVTKMVPVLTPLVLRQGPLVAKGAFAYSPSLTVARVDHLQLGDAWLHGAARLADAGWEGAVAGQFGFVPLGVSRHAGVVQAQPFVGPSWLDDELEHAGVPEAVLGEVTTRPASMPAQARTAGR